MNIVFLGSTGVHQTLLAAHLYLDSPSNFDYRNYVHFNDYQQEASGCPVYIGCDQAGRSVHCLGVGEDVKMVKKTLNHLRIILDTPAEKLQLVPIMIKSQRLICFLHRLARLACLKPLSSFLIMRLLIREYDHIKRQIPPQGSAEPI